MTTVPNRMGCAAQQHGSQLDYRLYTWKVLGLFAIRAERQLHLRLAPWPAHIRGRGARLSVEI